MLGVDMSKDWFHACLMDKSFNMVYEGQVVNQTDQIFEFISTLLKEQHIADINRVFMCMEHTGLYIQNLVRAWSLKGGRLAVISATKISNRLAGSQGWVEKADNLDARRIAEHGIRFADKLACFEMKSPALQLLRRLQRQRKRLLTALHLLEVPVNESKAFDSIAMVDPIQLNQASSVQSLKADLKKVDTQLEETVKEDPYLHRIFKLMSSVEGIGPITSTEVLIATEGFTKFTPAQAKKFSRYAGVVPMEHTSGSSIRKRSRTTKRANGRLKSLLTMGALSLTNTPGELGAYYRRKILEGKQHLSVINAMRNKLILRIFAVVRNDTIYVPNFKYVQ
jgi:transposase